MFLVVRRPSKFQSDVPGMQMLLLWSAIVSCKSRLADIRPELGLFHVKIGIYIYIIYIYIYLYLLFECIRHIFTSTLSQLYIYIYLFIQFKCTCKRVISIHCMLKSASNIHPWDVGVFKLGSCTPKIAFLCGEKDTEACDFGVYLNFRDLNIYIWSAPNLDSPKSIQFHQTRCIHTESCC